MDAVYVFGCFDECDESQSLWLISQIEEQMRTIEEPLKVVIVTTKGTKPEQKIVDALLKMPEKSVTTVDYSGAHVARDDSETGLELPFFFQEDPRYAEQRISEIVERLYTSCRQDEDLNSLLLTLLKSSPDHTQMIQLSGSKNPLHDQIFAVALEAISVENRSRALKVFSWLLTLRRPLRVFEFVTLCQLPERACDTGCSHQWISRRNPRIRYEAGKILQSLGGLLGIKHDEVHFSHPELRSWLLSRGEVSTSGGQWFHLDGEAERHADILGVCLTCLSHLTGDQNTDALFTYAIEHWIHHYKMADGSRHNAVLNDVFGNPKVLGDWIVAYGRLPAPFVKPQPGVSRPLAIAAHFALDHILRALLVKERADTETWKEAMLGCVRMGNLSTLRLLYGAAPVTLDFDNDILHEIVKEAGMNGHVNVLRDVVQRIPVPTHDKPDWKSMRTRAANKDLPATGEHEFPKAATLSPDSLTTGEDGTFRSQNTAEIKLQKPTVTQTVRGNTSEEQDEGARVLQLSPPKIRTDVSIDTEPPGEGHLTDEDESKAIKPYKSSPLVQPTPFDWLDLSVCRAARYGLHDVVDKLLSLGANPDATATPDSKIAGTCALGEAGGRGQLDTVRVLLNYGAEIELKSGPYVSSTLFLAVDGGNSDVIKLLLEKGATVESTNDDGRMPVQHASSCGHHAALKALIQHTPLSEYKMPTKAPLACAAYYGRYHTMKILLEAGVDPNGADEDGSALWHAISDGRIDICELLLNEGQPWKADPNFAPENLTPPLTQAIEEGNLDIVKLLLERGADIQKAETSENFKRTPLTTAILFDTDSQIDIVRYLLEKNADPLAVDEEDWTPVWTAANDGVSIEEQRHRRQTTPLPQQKKRKKERKDV